MRRTRRLMPSRAVPAALLLSLLPHAAPAQPREDWSISLTMENDAFFGSSDSSYTNGIRVSWDLLRYSRRLTAISRVLTLEALVDKVRGGRALTTARDACAPHEAREGGTRNCMSLGFSIAQTMFTPSDIIDPRLQVDDRPYAGMLFGSVYVNRLRNRAQYATELQLGVIGPASRAEDTQSLAHWTWSSVSGKPRGWDNQLRNRLQVGLVNTYQYRLFERCTAGACNGASSEGRWFDLTPRVEGVLATHMVRGSGGALLRLGYGFPDAVGLTRVPTTMAVEAGAGRPAVWFNGFVSIDQRAVLHNTFITGASPFGADRWNDVRRIGLARSVRELSGGGALGFSRGTIVVQVVQRSREYVPDGGSHRFGSVTLMLHTPKVAGK
ncbi:MAG: lipid A deacylase LpxR family protein [Gemmatimonadaceae bacterium]|nr:lipid A deacylase LpxR family protein [Gemmatimonadaceae bacterium]